jgi:hypothetical protein
MKALYIALVNRLKTKVPELVTIDFFNNQLQNMMEKQVVFFPCVLIEFEEIIFTNRTENIQEANIRLRFHLAQNIIGLDTYEGSENITDALAIFDLKDKVNQALMTFSETNTSDFRRIGERNDAQYTNVHVIELVYECLYIDTTHWIGNEYDQEVNATLELDADLIVDNDTIRTGILPQN